MTACAGQRAPEIVTEFEIIKLTRKVFVPIPETMTAPVEEGVIYVPDGDVDTIDMRTTLSQCQTQVRQCNGKLGEIGAIEGTALPADD